MGINLKYNIFWRHRTHLSLANSNAHRPPLNSISTYTRGWRMAGSINGSDYCILNWDSPTRVPPNAEPCSPDVSLVSASLNLSGSWQTLSTLSSDHLPISFNSRWRRPPTQVCVVTISTGTYIDKKWRPSWASVSFQQTVKGIYHTVLRNHIPTGRHRLHEEPVPAEILGVMTRQDGIRHRDPPCLKCQ